MVETFFKTLKSKLVRRAVFQTRIEPTEALARHSNGFYNPRRRHSSLGFVSPIQSGKRSANQTTLTKLKQVQIKATRHQGTNGSRTASYVAPF